MKRRALHANRTSAIEAYESLATAVEVDRGAVITSVYHPSDKGVPCFMVQFDPHARKVNRFVVCPSGRTDDEGWLVTAEKQPGTLSEERYVSEAMGHAAAFFSKKVTDMIEDEYSILEPEKARASRYLQAARRVRNFFAVGATVCALYGGFSFANESESTQTLPFIAAAATVAIIAGMTHTQAVRPARRDVDIYPKRAEQHQKEMNLLQQYALAVYELDKAAQAGRLVCTDNYS